MQENAILVLSDNLITFSVILKATSQDFTASTLSLPLCRYQVVASRLVVFTGHRSLFYKYRKYPKRS